MELSLHGSQINLATRDKATTTPAVNYPVYFKRPASASVTLTTPSARLAYAHKLIHANKLQQSKSKYQYYSRSNKRHRPVSADCKHYSFQHYHHQHNHQYFTKNNVEDIENVDRLCHSPQKINKFLSSSNIYKLLLSEPVKRSWMTSDASTSTNDRPFSVTSKNANEMTSDNSPKSSNDSIKNNTKEIENDESSCDEEIDEEIENSNDLSSNPTTVKNVTIKNVTIKKKISSSPTNRMRLSSPLHTIKEANGKTSSPNRSASSSTSSSSTAAPLPSVTKTAGNLNKFNDKNGSKRNFSVPTSSTTTKQSDESSITSSVTKADLPGRVSFSKNAVYEIDYSDFENEMDTIRSPEYNENFRKKNVRFEDDFFNKINDSTEKKLTEDIDDVDGIVDNDDDVNIWNVKNIHDENNSIDVKNCIDNDNKYCCSLKCNTLKCSNKKSNEINGNDRIDESERIIEEYKREIRNINRRHELELKWSGNKLNATSTPLVDYLNSNNSHENVNSDSKNNENLTNESNQIISNEMNELNDNTKDIQKDYWKSPEAGNSPILKTKQESSNASDDSLARDSTSTVINNYMKTRTVSSPSMATTPASPPIISKVKDNSKILNDIKKPQPLNIRKIKSQIVNKERVRSAVSGSKMSKAKSIASIQNRSDSKLNEFHIDKVESWMSAHEDAFSDAGLGTFRKGKFGSTSNIEYKKSWRETPTSKTDDEGNYSLDDQIDAHSMDGSSFGEIEHVLKKLEGRCMKISFDSVKGNVSVPSLSIASSANSHAQNPNNFDADQSTDKVKKIFQYLDEVDYNCDKRISQLQTQNIQDSYQSDIDYTIDPIDVIADIPKTSDLMAMTPEQLAKRIISLSLRSNELSTAVQLSKEHLEKVQCNKEKILRLEKQMTQTRLKEQKNNYENIVTRHQGFIEQLLKDKAALCEKVSALSRRIESQQQASEHKLQTEIARIKETALASEKIRRERWVRENTKKIKELTIKGFEQEINRMSSEHQKVIMELKRTHQQEILDAVDECRQKHEDLNRNLRASYAQDREASIEKERNAIIGRFERQMENDQKTFEEQKNRLLAEFSAEKERIQAEQSQKANEFEMCREKLIQEKKDIIEHLNREFNEKIRMIEKRNQSEIGSIREQFESDFEIWKLEQETIYKLREVENANTIRQQCRLERDKQIDSIVVKVDAEALKIQQDFESKMSRVKNQYENELREMERNERHAREKYTETRTKLAECEANAQNFQSTAKQLEIQLTHSQRMFDNLSAEKEHFRENARKDVQHEIEAMRKEREDEIHQIHKRVQHAILKKDASMEVLQKENNSLKELRIKLETIIRQQRKDYCTK